MKRIAKKTGYRQVPAWAWPDADKYSLDKIPGNLSQQINTVFVKVPIDSIRALGEILRFGNYLSFKDTAPTAKEINAFENSLKKEVSDGIAAVGGRAFIKLASRSPKDAWLPPGETLMIDSYERMVQVFSQSERIMEDLAQYLSRNLDIYLAIREWSNIPQKDEFRCFIYDGELIGVSQYFYHDYFPELVGRQEAVFEKVEVFVQAIITELAAAGLTRAVADVWYRGEEKECFLIEVNPFSQSTDPCLYSWKDIAAGTNTKRMLLTESPAEHDTEKYTLFAARQTVE